MSDTNNLSRNTTNTRGHGIADTRAWVAGSTRKNVTELTELVKISGELLQASCRALLNDDLNTRAALGHALRRMGSVVWLAHPNRLPRTGDNSPPTASGPSRG